MSRSTHAREPGVELLKQVKAAFVLQGTSWSAWCAEKNLQRSACRQAVVGSWNGPKGQEMRELILREAGPLPELPQKRNGRKAA